MKKLVSIILLLAMMMAVLVACNGDEGGEETTPAADDNNGNNSVVSGDEETTTPYLPDRDHGGYVFRALGCDADEGIVYEEDDDVDTTTTLNKAAMERDAEVMDRLNCVLKDVQSGHEGYIVNYVLTDAMNPYSSFDCGNPWGGESLAPLISNDIVLDINELPHLNLDQEWYLQGAISEYTVMGKLYGSSAVYPGNPGSCPLWFNKDMMLELNLELPYDTILAGEWTIEKMMEYTSAAYKDLGTAGRDENDFFGYAGHDRSICYFYQGMGGQTSTRDENGAVVPVISDDKVDAIFSKVSDFYFQPYCWTNSSLEAGVHSSSHRMFYDGNSLFCYWVTATLRAEEIDTFDRGLAILPKYDLDQETYCCPGGGFRFFPANLENVDYSAYIYEALCEAAYRITFPAAIQEAVEFETLTDEGSIEVQKLVVKSISFDILKNFDPSGMLSSCGYVWYCIQNKTTPSAAASSVKDVLERQFSQFFYGDE